MQLVLQLLLNEVPPAVDRKAQADGPDWARGVLESLYSVAFATVDREVAGVLVGMTSAAGTIPQIQAIIPAGEGFQAGQAAMFGHESWAHVHQAMARHYGGLEVVGWYVSRPGAGTGLLDADVLNHQRWFARPDQVLLVFDSRTHRAALYASDVRTGLVRLHEGPVARRYTRAPQEHYPIPAMALLAALGVLLGALAFLAFNTF